MNVNETYEQILEYQLILTEKFKLEEKMEELPKILSSKNEILNKLKKSYLNKHTQFKKLEESIYANQRKMGELNLQQKHIEEKTKVIKSHREYEALDKEKTFSIQKEEEYKFQLLQDQRVIEDLRNALEKDEISIKQHEDEIAKEQERVNGELDKIKDELNKLNSKEEELIQHVDEGFKYKFEKIVKNKDGKGIVTVSKGHCNGCHLILPPEFINEIRSGAKIQYCPNCSRILFYNEGDEDIFNIEDFEDNDDFFESED